METKSKENKPKSLKEKLLAFQMRIAAIKKDGVNPHFKSNYATLPHILSEVKPLLSECGLLLLQPIRDGMVKTAIFCPDTEESIDSNMAIPSGLNPQQVGSCITYYRRYLLAGLLSLEIEDDDANEATKAPVISAEQRLRKAETLAQLAEAYNSLTPSEKARYKDLKDQLKTTLQ